MPRAAQSAWREGSNLLQNSSRNYVHRHSKSCPRPKMLYFSWTAWTEIVGKVARVAKPCTDRLFPKMGECREVLGGGPAPPSKL